MTAITILTGLTLLGTLLGMYRTFAKANESGIAAFVPVWNFVTLCKVAGAPPWWAVFFFVPLFNLVFVFFLMRGIANNFNKSTLFAAGLTFLPPIFLFILGFGKAEYRTDKQFF